MEYAYIAVVVIGVDLLKEALKKSFGYGITAAEIKSLKKDQHTPPCPAFQAKATEMESQNRSQNSALYELIRQREDAQQKEIKALIQAVSRIEGHLGTNRKGAHDV